MGNNILFIDVAEKNAQNQQGAVDFVFDRALSTQGGQVSPGVEVMVWDHLHDSNGNSVGLITVNNGTELYVIQVGVGVSVPFRNTLNNLTP